MTVSNGSGPSLQSSHEDKILLVVTLIIGAVVGLVVVAFILLTENLGSRLYPAGSAAWRRVLMPVIGAVSTGFLLYRYFRKPAGAGFHRLKPRCFSAKVSSACGQCSGSSGSARCPWPRASPWAARDLTKAYNDFELEFILAYLRSTVQP